MRTNFKFALLAALFIGCGKDFPEHTGLIAPTILEVVPGNVDWVSLMIRTNVDKSNARLFMVALFKANGEYEPFEPYRKCWDFEGEGQVQCVASELVEGSVYHFKALNCPAEEGLKEGIDQSKCSDFSETVVVTTPKVSLKAPTGLRVTLEYAVEVDDYSYHALEIAWADGSLGATGYRLESAYDEFGPWYYHGEVDATQREMSVLYLEPETTYWLRLRSFHVDVFGQREYSDYSNSIEFTTSE